MTVGTVVVMFSHERREDARAATIRDFAEVGCPVAHVRVQEEPIGQARGRRNAWLALREAALVIAPEVSARGVLVIEDDVIPAGTLPEWLAYLEGTQDRPVSLYLPTDLQARMLTARLGRWEAERHKPVESRVVSMREPKFWWGSQAVWLPVALAERVALDARFGLRERGLGPWDYALRVAFVEAGATLGVAVPNVVQHRDERNLVVPGRRLHRSVMFDPTAAAPILKEEQDASR